MSEGSLTTKGISENLISSKPRGFAALIEKIMSNLNDNSKFKENYKKEKLIYVINASNLNHAGLVIIENGTITVKSIPNKPKTNLSKKKLKWDGLISMDSQIFLGLAMDKISVIGIGVRWLTGKVKMKGLFKLLKLLKIFEMLKE